MTRQEVPAARGLDWRYVMVGLLVGVAVCSVTGAVAGVIAAVGGGSGQTGAEGAAAAGAVIASGLAGLIIGAALGGVLGSLSGVVTTLAVGRRTDPGRVAVRAALAVGLTYLVVLAGLAALDYGRGWAAPSVTDWVGVLVPAVAAALLAGRAARDVPEPAGPPTT
ncbi:hypothetical protein [Ornithinimicrobium avium]|uniref:Uncharacterized protein n=1 Tax=Ornithinimicrobium avium TaxID=2283195 RepID=A0A345NRT7_9MICO|nr:hypothetical protein [Ornithinimicrobium avium]AXH97745.1 hypothetical protein DV701_17955 [Ornithinimicrobium avium]